MRTKRALARAKICIADALDLERSVETYEHLGQTDNADKRVSLLEPAIDEVRRHRDAVRPSPAIVALPRFRVEVRLSASMRQARWQSASDVQTGLVHGRSYP